MLASPDLQHPSEVICDASDEGIQAILVQDGRPLACWAKCITEAEQNNAFGEEEVLAVVNAFEMWHCYLDSPDFHHSLIIVHIKSLQMKGNALPNRNMSMKL